MKYLFFASLLMSSFGLCALGCKDKDNGALKPIISETSTDTTKQNSNKMNIIVGTKKFIVTLEDNATTTAFKALLPLNMDMVELNGNEKYAELSRSLPTKSSNPGTIHNGDLMLYGSSTVVLFYKSFNTSYSYTKLGKIDDPSGLAAALGTGNVKVRYEQ
jgi:hypothetical protein